MDKKTILVRMNKNYHHEKNSFIFIGSRYGNNVWL